MHVISLFPLLTALVATAPALSKPLWRDHEHRCDVNQTTVTHTVTQTTTVLASSTNKVLSSQVALVTSQPVSSSSASKIAAASSSSKAAVASSASSKATVFSSSSISKASSSASPSKASSSAAASSKVTSSSAAATTSKVAATSKAAMSSSSTKAATSTSSAASSASTATTDANAQTFLDLHNNFRKHYEANAVTWNHTLATYAQTTTNTCVFKHTGGPYGENLAAGVGGGYNITSGFNSWANEASEYDASNPQYSHFTQVVWKGTTQIGCATSSCADGTIFSNMGGQESLYIVCEYYPPGNVIGQFAQNVGTYEA